MIEPPDEGFGFSKSFIAMKKPPKNSGQRDCGSPSRLLFIHQWPPHATSFPLLAPKAWCGGPPLPLPPLLLRGGEGNKISGGFTPGGGLTGGLPKPATRWMPQGETFAPRNVVPGAIIFRPAGALVMARQGREGFASKVTYGNEHRTSTGRRDDLQFTYPTSPARRQ
jgi:hypothetical protein